MVSVHQTLKMVIDHISKQIPGGGGDPAYERGGDARRKF